MRAIIRHGCNTKERRVPIKAGLVCFCSRLDAVQHVRRETYEGPHCKLGLRGPAQTAKQVCVDQNAQGGDDREARDMENLFKGKCRWRVGHHAECANRRDPEAEQEQGDEQGGSKLEGQPHACKVYELGTLMQKQSLVRSENKNV